METITFIVSLVAGILVLCSSPIHGIVIYFALLAWYPSYLTVTLGNVDFSVCRILIFVLFVKFCCMEDLRRQFKLSALDTCVIFSFVAQSIAAGITEPFNIIIPLHGAALLETVLPYFSVRLAVTHRKRYLSFLKSILLITAPLAIVGVYQCFSGHNLLVFFEAYYAWAQKIDKSAARFGLTRAYVTFSHSIMYGLFFAMLWPICFGISNNLKYNKHIFFLGISIMIAGMLSSMSSGPLLTAFLTTGFICLFRWRSHWKPIVTAVIFVCLLLEIISNRHFYDLVDYFTFSGATAWYRSRLIDIALFKGGMSGHWLVGYGYAEPGWGYLIDQRNYTDMVNHYILILSRYGIVGFLPFFLMLIMAIKSLIRAYKASIDESSQWLVWCISGALFGILGTFNSVSLFGQTATVFYMILGLCGAMPAVVRSAHKKLQRN